MSDKKARITIASFGFSVGQLVTVHREVDDLHFYVSSPQIARAVKKSQLELIINKEEK